MKNSPHSHRIIFVTGTGTGVGKTLLTGLLLHHLRRTGVRALAIKPFCSGGRRDIEILRELQDRELSESEITPFYFQKPVAPLIEGRQKRRRIRLQEVVGHVRAIAGRCECLLVEGSGGLLVPLGEGYTVADLIKALRCEVIVAGWNRLGTINHSSLTVSHLQSAGIKAVRLVLMRPGSVDISTGTNVSILAELLGIEVLEIPFLGEKGGARGVAAAVRLVKKSVVKLQKTLARLVA